MRVPLTWLRDYVAITDSPEALASRLTFAGLEVEDIRYFFANDLRFLQQF